MNKTTTALTVLIEYIDSDISSALSTMPLNTPFIEYLREHREKAISLLQKEREDMEKVFEDCRRSTKIRYTSCGDPMMCGCMGSCERPVAYIPKVFADKEAKEYFNQSFTQYKTETNG